ncbi:MAG: histidine--tRNA ligase [Nitrososphaeraceae archaeon]|nr:histidine--tRNA ligase [Nitrososphaeraceae archaeon]MDW0138514.1 histidine--tRNA ligase [Nitrososphaeraceae archaeon]MDW0142770.1 histidine--tRNA ligase [Nitrososphaeraceae archaeon]MDW0145524.1 histidine--tRNA ligase [Nitrososphaeraceae archaeon]MDW0151275.1 histidine--tRNA ligase [Nitrososphaeraceae archaeon]
MKLDLPRGMRDVQYEELRNISFIRDKFVETAEIFDFNQIEPSTLELLSTLEAKSGPSIIQETYSFTDKGGRDIALRFDLTIGLSRFVSMRRDLKLPAKLSSFGGVWRYDEPQHGRYRYFHQWDVEIFGSPDVDADAEVIDFVSSFLSKLNIDFVILINHRSILEEYLSKYLGITDNSVISEMMRAIDKLSKKSSEQIINEYAGKLDSIKLQEFIKFVSVTDRPDKILDNDKLMEFKSSGNLRELIDSLKSRRVKNMMVDFRIVRGLDYYSGLVFEAKELSSQVGSLVGGGRYDKLTEAFGRKDLFATGAAGGVERILSAIKDKSTKILKKPLIYVAYDSKKEKKHALEVVSILRDLGYSTDYDINGRTISKQFHEASLKNALAIIIVSLDEFKKGIVTIKTGLKEQKQSITEIAKYLDQMI